MAVKFVSLVVAVAVADGLGEEGPEVVVWDFLCLCQDEPPAPSPSHPM